MGPSFSPLIDDYRSRTRVSSNPPVVTAPPRGCPADRDLPPYPDELPPSPCLTRNHPSHTIHSIHHPSSRTGIEKASCHEPGGTCDGFSLSLKKAIHWISVRKFSGGRWPSSESSPSGHRPSPLPPGSRTGAFLLFTKDRNPRSCRNHRSGPFIMEEIR